MSADIVEENGTPRSYDDLLSICYGSVTDSGLSLERMLLVVRMAREARRMLEIPFKEWPNRGHVLMFPNWVAASSGYPDYRTWPTYPSVEPGRFIPTGTTIVEWSVRTMGVKGWGQTAIRVGNTSETTTVSRPSFVSNHDGKKVEPPQWANQIPSVIDVPSMTKSEARRLLSRLAKYEETARQKIIEYSSALVHSNAKHHMRRLPSLGAVYGLDDIVQQGYIKVARAIDLFSSDDRPHCSWIWYCKQELYKDTQRSMARIGGESVNLAYLRSWLWNHPDVTSVQEARAGGVDTKYSDVMIEQALAHKMGQVSLDSQVWADNNGSGLDRNPALGYEDESLDSDPSVTKRLAKAIEQAGLTVQQIEPWLYKIGALDYPHTNEEVYKRYRKRPKQVSAMEAAFFAGFVSSGESWDNIEDRPAIRARAKEALFGE